MTLQRVLLYSEYYLPHHGGIELHVHALARRLQRIGMQVTVATPFRGPDLVDRVPVHRIRVPMLPFFHTVWGPHPVHPLKGLLGSGGFDVVHCHYSIYNPSASAVVYLAQRMGLPTVVTFHSVMRGYTLAFSLFDRLTGWSLQEVMVPIPKRTDCARCFFQRLSEWWWLWKQFPDIFADAEAQEERYGHTFRSETKDNWPGALKGLRAEFEAGRIPRGADVQINLFEEMCNDKCRVCSL